MLTTWEEIKRKETISPAFLFFFLNHHRNIKLCNKPIVKDCDIAHWDFFELEERLSVEN